MKKLHLIFIVILGISLITSCSKDENITDGDKKMNLITFKGKEYPISIGMKKTYNGYYQLLFANSSPKNYTGKFNFVGILFKGKDGKINTGTYTFKIDSDPTYDSKLNFFDGEAGTELQMNNGNPDTSTNYFKDISSGKVVIKQSNGKYEIVFNLVFKEGEISGNFNGKVIDL